MVKVEFHLICSFDSSVYHGTSGPFRWSENKGSKRSVKVALEYWNTKFEGLRERTVGARMAGTKVEITRSGNRSGELLRPLVGIN